MPRYVSSAFQEFQSSALANGAKTTIAAKGRSSVRMQISSTTFIKPRRPPSRTCYNRCLLNDYDFTVGLKRGDLFDEAILIEPGLAIVLTRGIRTAAIARSGAARHILGGLSVSPDGGHYR